MMFRRHQHHWTEVSRRFNEPQVDVTKAETRNSDLVLQLVYGVTVVELRCDECGDIKGVRYVGEAR